MLMINLFKPTFNNLNQLLLILTNLFIFKQTYIFFFLFLFALSFLLLLYYIIYYNLLYIYTK
jgi:hypothetical protein